MNVKAKSWFERWKMEHESQLREYRYTLHLIRRSLLTMFGVVIITLLVITAIFAPWIAPYDPEKTDLENRFQPPSWEHPFGTDQLGRDILSRVIHASRYDLIVGVLVVTVATSLGSIIGVIASYFGGKIDEILMRITDIFFAVPALILAMAFAAAIGERGLQAMMLALSLTWWPYYPRIIRGQVLSIKEQQYVEAARSLGASDWRIIFRHILPNTLAPVLVQASLDIGYVILTAASLSFIGFGAQPGVAEWGRMVADGRKWIGSAPWMVTFPGLTILITVLGYNLLGDGIRDIMDPKLRR